MAMEIKTRTETRTHYSAEAVLSVVPPEENRDRGLYYRPDSDEAAYAAAKSFFDKAAEAIRAKAKITDMPVHLHLSFDARGVVATASATKVG